MSIAPLFPGTYTTPLEQILVSATDNSAVKRPNVDAFSQGLNSWLRNHENFGVSNPLQWEEALKKLFPRGFPKSAEWVTPDQIVEVLNQIAYPNLNHMFYPSGGGNDFSAAQVSEQEAGCIEIKALSWNLLKPLRLVFHGFPDSAEWSYFRLESDTLAPCGVYESDDGHGRECEEVTRVNLLTYADRGCWDDGYFQGSELPDAAHPLVRWFGGSFVFFQKTSFYNLVKGRRGALDAYRGRHNQMSDLEFLGFVSEMKRISEERGIDLRSGRYEI